LKDVDKKKRLATSGDVHQLTLFAHTLTPGFNTKKHRKEKDRSFQLLEETNKDRVQVDLVTSGQSRDSQPID